MGIGGINLPTKKDFAALVASQGERVDQQERMSKAVNGRAEQAVSNAKRIRKQAKALKDSVQQLIQEANGKSPRAEPS